MRGANAVDPCNEVEKGAGPIESQRWSGCCALRACGRTFGFRYPDHHTASLVKIGFGGLLVPFTSSSRQTQYRIERSARRGFRVQGAGCGVACADAGDLLFQLDKSLTIALQRERPDLYFLHAGAVALDGRVAVLAAPPGTGKSTLTLWLLQNGFDYLSDELAPIDPRRLSVEPYAHALCLKCGPPLPCRVPPGALATGARLHLPVHALGARFHREPQLLAAIFFLRRAAAVSSATCRRMSAARALAHLMANSLNPLAHPGGGLDVALSLARRVPCFELNSSDLDDARQAVAEVLGGASAF